MNVFENPKYMPSWLATNTRNLQTILPTGLKTSIALCNKQHVMICSPHSLNAADELKKLSRDKYSLAELQKKPLPEGVDPKKLESYLSEEEF